MVDAQKVSTGLGWTLFTVSLVLFVVFAGIAGFFTYKKRKDKTPAWVTVLWAFATLFLGMAMAALILNLTYKKEMIDLLVKTGAQASAKLQQAGAQLIAQAPARLQQLGSM